MPYKTWGCSICGMQCPKEWQEHDTFKERMAWLRRHYKFHHPDEFTRMIRMGTRTRKLAKH